jgi:hypothetical protein
MALALCLPLSVLQNLIMNPAPWWRLPYLSIAIASAPVILAYVIVGWALLRGKRLGYYLVKILSGAWLLQSGWMAIHLRNVSLGFFALFLGVLLLSFIAWIRVELNRSFFNPRIRWFEGLPKPIPGLECELLSESDRPVLRVNRIDREGAFLFCEPRQDDQGAVKLNNREAREILFSFRDRKVQCRGVAIRVLNRMGAQTGVGIQFTDMSLDARKMLGDFVETLKGEGYVS